MSELRRRNVLRIGAAYLAVAWLLIQVTQTLFPVFGLGATAIRSVVVVLIVGLLPALIFAWAFEITPDGLKRESEVDRSQSITPQTGKKLDRVIMGVLALALGYFAVDKFVLAPQREQTMTEAARAEGRTESLVKSYGDKSLAVLPFVNMSSDPEQEYFSDGISAQVLDLVARIPEIRVIARTSSFSFRGKDVDVATIAKRLNVSHVLEGSVRKSGSRVRVTAQLIRTADSSHMWSNTYDRELKDIFAVQDEVAAAVVRQLKVALLGGQLPTRSPATSLDAYNLYLKARYLFDQHSEDGMAKSVEYYRRALARDPVYAQAWAGLAEAQAVRADEGYVDYEATPEEARAAARRALELDPAMAKAHFALGLVQFGHDWDWSAADASFKRSIDLDPSEAKALSLAGSLAYILGRDAEGIDLCRQAVAHNPIGPYERLILGYVLLHSGSLDDAEKEIRAGLELAPEYAQGWYTLGLTLLLKGQSSLALEAMQKEPSEDWRLPGLPLAFHALGQNEAAEAALQEAIEKYAETMPYQIGLVYAYRGEADQAFSWFERAYLQRDPGLAWYFRTDPLLANLRSDPRYVALLRKLKLPEN